MKLSRYKEENDDLNEEIRECNAYNPDLAVAFHTNSGGGTGFEVYHHQGTGNSYKLAVNINNEVVAAKLKSRGVKCRLNSSGGQYYGFIRNTKASSVITEMAFIDNINDIKNFDEDHEIEVYAVCIAKAILKTLGIAWKDEKPQSPPPAPSKPTQPESTEKVYRVLTNGTQVGAFSNKENILKEVEKALNNNAALIEIKKK